MAIEREVREGREVREVREVRDDRQDRERARAVDLAVGQIEKQFGKGSIMRLGQKGAIQPIDAIPTGAISIDYALMSAACCADASSRFCRVVGKTTLAQVIGGGAEAWRHGGVRRCRACLTRAMPRSSAGDLDNLLVSQLTTASRRSRSSRS